MKKADFDGMFVFSPVSIIHEIPGFGVPFSFIEISPISRDPLKSLVLNHQILLFHNRAMASREPQRKEISCFSTSVQQCRQGIRHAKTRYAGVESDAID